MYLLFLLEEKARGFAVSRNLGSKGQVANVFECQFKLIEVISTELEMPEVILGVLWALSLIMDRDCIQWSSILQVVSGDNANDMRIRPHNHPGVLCWIAPTPVVSNDAGHVVSPAIEIKA